MIRVLAAAVVVFAAVGTIVLAVYGRTVELTEDELILGDW